VRSRRHPAARTRRGLVAGTILATAGLTGAYWVGDLGGATEATTTTAADAVSESSSSSTADQPSSFDDELEDDTFDDDTSDPVDVAPSAATPDTSSRAS
jgi:hypothetical protein